jgi:N-acetylmuramoyl-L-alanine amidase
MKKLTIYLDAGHGGIDTAGKYTTAPSKMFIHDSGKFHDGSTFYEGVSNRVFAALATDSFKAQGYDVVPCFDAVADTSLGSRAAMANKHFRQLIQRDRKAQGLFLSLHSDAHNGKARGFTCFSAENARTSALASAAITQVLKSALVPTFGVTARSPKQKNLSVLRNTVMPAVLFENLFFDNLEDATLLMRQDYQKAFALALPEAVDAYAYSIR